MWRRQRCNELPCEARRRNLPCAWRRPPRESCPARWPCRQRTRPSGDARWRWWRSCCRARCMRRPCRAAGGDGGGAGALVGGAERAVPGAEVVLRSAESSRRSMARASKSAATVRRPHEYCLTGSRGRQGELEAIAGAARARAASAKLEAGSQTAAAVSLAIWKCIAGQLAGGKVIAIEQPPLQGYFGQFTRFLFPLS
ncbi:hypothetical protein PVAP13_3NG043080 [Panicum virgatum]|uniref:Uncharacterized protein n=1 Tax=Panicum virgatum TaxID=38727 RepID=A0A8T0U5V8_PANVG|nr:hypothetical protein PVAP13_3NG043080 [Panicum virgatum]